MEYKIEIYYATGNSFGSSDEIDQIDLTWKNIDIAKENLKRIKEHYTQYKELTSYSYGKNRKNIEILLSNKDKDWFVYKSKLFYKMNGRPINEKEKEKLGEDNCEYLPDQYNAQYTLKIKADNGNEMNMTAFWCGHFETLHSAEIITMKDENLKIEF